MDGLPEHPKEVLDPWIAREFSGFIPQQIQGKGLINQIFILCSGEVKSQVVKRFDQTDLNYQDRLAFELEDLQLLSELVPTPKIMRTGPDFFTMSYHAQEKVNWKLLIKALETLHKKTNPKYGYHRDSFYGKWRLKNGWWDNWWDFFLQTRLNPLILDLDQKGDFDLVAILSFLGDHVHLLGTPDSSSLLHGDCWANNILFDGKKIILIDPVCFYGDPLMDYAKFSNKHSNKPRAVFYRIYYAIDFYLFTGDRTYDSHLRKFFDWILLQRASPLNICPLVVQSNMGTNFDINPFLFDPDKKAQYHHLTDFQRPNINGVICFGAFNPPHPNHISLLENAYNFLSSHTQQITIPFFCPAPLKYLESKKSGVYFSSKQRIQLLIKRVREKDDTDIEYDESNEWNPFIFHYCVSHKHVVSLLEQYLKGIKLYVVLGSDTIEKALKLVPDHVGLIVYFRNGNPLNQEQIQNIKNSRKGQLIYFDTPESQIWSSTLIRNDPSLFQQYSTI